MKLSELYRSPFFTLLAVQFVIAYEWLGGGFGKLQGGVFVKGIAKSFAAFEKANPHTWYVNTILNGAKQNAVVFAQLVQWGELLVGIGLVVSILLFVFGKSSTFKRSAAMLAVASLIGGAFMNANFYYAAGWTSASTGGLNMVMFWIEIILLIAWVGRLCQKNEK